MTFHLSESARRARLTERYESARKQDAEFDKLADAMIRRIERAVSTFDPDEVDVEMSGDVLNLTLGNGQNCHQPAPGGAAKIWMAAQRKRGTSIRMRTVSCGRPPMPSLSRRWKPSCQRCLPAASGSAFQTRSSERGAPKRSKLESCWESSSCLSG